MKAKIISALKILLPLGFGVFIIWLFYDALCEDQRTELFRAFGEANYTWVFIGLLMGWASHLSRAYRWKYLLEPMGYKVKFWQLYHAVMIGYIVNLIFPRAGEASRAGVLTKTDNVPFQKGFGSIIAERAVDVGVLGTLTVLTLILQADKLDLFQAKIDAFNAGEVGCGNTLIFSILGKIVTYGVLGGIVGAVVLFAAKPSFRAKIREFIRGIFEGVMSIFRTKNKLPFIGHTLIIWVLYVAMIAVNFQAIDATSGLGLDAMLAGFVAGAIGIVLVQGGIGVYPAFVGLIVTIYLPDAPDGIAPQALALGWLAWTSQTIMVVVLGLISLIANGKNVKFTPDESAETTEQ